MSGKRHYEKPYNAMVFGTNHEQPNVGSTRQSRRDSDDIADLGRTAIKGVVTVGAVGITAGLMGGILGSFKP